ncbi:MAG TPA: hypothetical protein VMZ32_06875 [Gammaproteobacteria bacterium]|nr:hypothetical protein [Gammaproteobacteria bacterium]
MRQPHCYRVHVQPGQQQAELYLHDPHTRLEDMALTHANLHRQAQDCLLDGIRLAMSD